MKFTPAAAIFTTASLGFGCGTGTSTYSIASGPPTCFTCMAFMPALDSPKLWKDSERKPQGFKVSRFQGFEVSKSQSFKVSRFQGFEVSRFQGSVTLCVLCG